MEYMNKTIDDIRLALDSNSISSKDLFDEAVFKAKKYQDDLNNLQSAEWIICDDTFEMKKKMFENSDLIVVLPGGFGTISEVFSFIEENRSNDKLLPIEIYDEDNYYKNMFKFIEEMRMKKFVSDDIYNYFDLSHNKDEFIDHLNKTIFKRRSK